MEKKKKDENDGDLFGVAEDESNEQFMATKPWIGALVAPTEGNKINPYLYYYTSSYIYNYPKPQKYIKNHSNL